VCYLFHTFISFMFFFVSLFLSCLLLLFFLQILRKELNLYRWLNERHFRRKCGVNFPSKLLTVVKLFLPSGFWPIGARLCPQLH